MSSGDQIRVMVVDDHLIMRSGLRDVLEASGRLEVVGEAGDGEGAVRTVEEVRPEVIVMDVIMPNKDGIDACREIMELLRDTRVLMLTASPELHAVIESIADGATGYLQKYSLPEELVEAVLDVAQGRLRMPEEAVKEVFAMVRGERDLAHRRPSDRLTEPERKRASLPRPERMAQAAPAFGVSPSEKRTLDLVTDHPMIPREHLALWRRVSEGRVSQMMRSLVDTWNLIERHGKRGNFRYTLSAEDIRYVTHRNRA